MVYVSSSLVRIPAFIADSSFFPYQFQLRIDFSLYPLRERPRKLQKYDPFSYLSCGLFKLLFIFLPNSFYISRFPYAYYMICIIICG